MIQAVGKGLIVTAPSNAAVANVALKVQSSSYYDLEKIVVFGKNCDESVRFMNPLHRSEKFYKWMKSYKTLADEDDLAKDRKVKEFAQWLKLDDEDLDVVDLAQLCPYIDMSKNSGRVLFSEILKNASVIFSTLNTSGSNMLRNAVQIDTYILDEGGQCTESGKIFCIS